MGREAVFSFYPLSSARGLWLALKLGVNRSISPELIKSSETAPEFEANRLACNPFRKENDFAILV